MENDQTELGSDLLSLLLCLRHLSQLSQWWLVCSACAQWGQQTKGETKDESQKLPENVSHFICVKMLNVCVPVYTQGDVVLQSDHVIETLTKIAICADKINSININQGRWESEQTQQN